MIKFENLVGMTGVLCAVEGQIFRIGDLVFEVVDDPSDGYRSYLGAIQQTTTKLRPTFREEVTIHQVTNDCGFTGFTFTNSNGHIVLQFGTDYHDAYYPYFVYLFHPKLLTENYNLSELLNTVTE